MTERERLIELLWGAIPSKKDAEDTADYLLENGVIVPPCKVGDKVYTKGHRNRKSPVEWEVVGVWFSVDKSCNYMHLYWYKDKDNFVSRQMDFSEIGKTVFLTKEEAEQALKGGGKE